MPDQPVALYIAYVPADEDLLKRLRIQLVAIERIGLVDAWHDGEVAIGTDREAAMLGALRQSDIILLLISADFFASEFAYDQEMKIALELEKEGKAKVFPIILRECTWKYTPLATLRILPDEGIPVTSSHWQSPDQAFSKVVEKIINTIQEPKIPQSQIPNNPETRTSKNPPVQPSAKIRPIPPIPRKIGASGVPSQNTIPLNDLHWAAENLLIPTTEGTCHAGNDGSYYDFKAAKASCPPGWRLPSKKEWAALSPTQIEELQLSYNGLYDRGYQRDKDRKAYYWSDDHSGGGEAWCFEKMKNKEGRVDRRYTHWALNCRLVKVD